jgi:hypothetical protein
MRHLEHWSALILSRNTPMCRQYLGTLTLALGGIVALPLTASAQVKSGPQPGDFLPGSFAPYNLSGPSKGLYHSLVCEYGLRPTVMVFVRERGDGPNPAVLELLKKLDEVLPRFQTEGLKGSVVVLSPDARSSVFVEKTEDVDKVLLEEDRREKLRARLEKFAEPFKNLVVATYPAEGPRGYAIAPKADVTVIFYDRLKVAQNWSFEGSQLDPQAVQRIVDGVETALRPQKKEKRQEGQAPGK